MASGGSERLYEEDDRLDERLLNQISKWIMYNRLPSLARHLGFSDAEVSRIMFASRDPEEQCFQILKRWHQKNTLTIKEVVESMVEWQQGRCLDPGVWNHLRPNLNHTLMPPDSIVQPRRSTMPNIQDLQLEDSARVEVLYSQDRIETPCIVEMPLDDDECLGAVVQEAVAKIDDTPPRSHEISAEIEHKKKEDVDKFSHEKHLAFTSVTSEKMILPSNEEVLDLQLRLKDSLDRTWKNSLSHDWIPVEKAKTFPLREFYVGLRWIRVVKRAIKNFKEELKSIYDILQIVDITGRPRAINILVTAAPGMGKTCSMAKLALDWNPESPDASNPVNSFDFVFLLRLRYMDKKSSLGELIVAQHEKLEVEDIKHIEAILKGKTKHRVLLIMDGYDEYKPGSNKEIDKAIESSIGNCFLILTSRPDLPSKKGQYVSQKIRDRMDGEVIIEGFNEENITKCSALYLESNEKSAVMLKEAAESGIDVLLKVPIILLMVCVLFSEYTYLSKTRTKIVGQIFELTTSRTILKHFEANMMDVDDLLFSLGELSWEALQRDVQQLLLEKDELERKSPLLLKLGLLFETGTDTASVRNNSLLSFYHKIFQEYSGAYFVSKTLQKSQDIQEAMNELFPTLYDVKRLEEVVLFTGGLMPDPTPLVDHVYNLHYDRTVQILRTGEFHDDKEEKMKRLGKDLNVSDLLESIYKESTIKLSGTAVNNQHINCYFADNLAPMYFPSKTYVFDGMENGFALMPRSGDEDIPGELPHSLIIASCSQEVAANSILNTIHRISRLQPIRDLWVFDLTCNEPTITDIFRMSKTPLSINLANCVFPATILGNLLQQISNSSTLNRIDIQGTSLQDIKCLSFQYLPSLTHLGMWNTNLCQFHILHLAYLLENRKLPQLSVLDIGGNNMNHLQGDLEVFLSVIDKHHLKSIRVDIRESNLPKMFFQKVRKYTNPPSLLCIVSDKCNQNIVETESAVRESKSEVTSIWKILDTWQTEEPLQVLSLANRGLPQYSCTPILKALSSHRNITNLDLSGNLLGIYGYHLVNTIMTWGPEPVLTELDLSDCSLPVEVCRPLLSVIGRCTSLVELWLPGNTLTACLQNFLADHDSILPFLQELFLSYTKLNAQDLPHLAQLIQSEKMPQLTELDLGANGLHRMEEPLEELVQTLTDRHQREMKLNLYFNRLSPGSVQTIKGLCQNTDIVLEFG